MNNNNSVSEFMAQETGIINDFAQAMKDRGFDAEWYYNLQGEPTVAVHLVNNDGDKTTFSACLDIVSE